MGLVHGRDPEGRPLATADDGTADSAALAGFLTQEVQWPDYADLLRERAEDAVAGRTAESTSGNAYGVDFARDAVTITHLHLADRVPVRVAPAAFIAALRAWAAFLRGV